MINVVIWLGNIKYSDNLAIILLCTMPISIFAEETLVPQEVIASTKDDCNIIEKVYVLPKDTDESLIPTEAFTENEIEYMFSEMKVQDNTVLAALMTTVCVVGMKLSNNQQKVDQSVDWLKRIWIAWDIINGIGAFLAYVRPLLDGLATIT